MKRILLGCFVLGVLVLGFVNVNAQAVTGTDIADDDRGEEVYASPDVQVSDVKLDKATYIPGDQVKITFSSENYSTEYIADLYYKIQLFRTDESGIEYIYDEVAFKGTPLTSRELRYESLEYSLPKRILTKGTMIRVQSYTDNESASGFDDTPISISGNIASPIIVKDAYLVLNGNKYSLEEGPTLDKGAEVKLHLDLVSTDTKTVIPRIRIVSNKDIASGLVNKSYDPIIISTTKKSVEIPLPKFDESGVYVGSFSFVDEAEKKPISEILTLRYIVGGSQADIYSLMADTGKVEKGGTFDVSVGYAGAPYNIVTKDLRPQGEAVLTVNVFNELDQLVATEDKKISLEPREMTADFNLIANKSAKALRAEVTITKDGKVLSERNAIISSDYDSVSDEAKNPLKKVFDDKNILAIIGGVILFVIVLILIMAGIIRKKNITAIMILIVGIAGASVIVTSGKVSAQDAPNNTPVLVHSTSYHNTILGMKFAQIKVPSIVVEGTNFDAAGGATYPVCSNTSNDFKLSMILRKDNGDSKYDRNDAIVSRRDFDPAASIIDGHDHYNVTKKYKTGGTKHPSFTAPQQGHYFMQFSASVNFWHPDYGSSQVIISRWYKLDVVEKDVCPNVGGVQTSLPCPSGGNLGGNTDTDYDGTTVPGCTVDDEVNWSGKCENVVAGKGVEPGVVVYSCADNTGKVVSRACTAGLDGLVACPFADVEGNCLIPDIIKFESKSLIPKGEKCELVWEVKNSQECSIEPQVLNSNGDLVSKIFSGNTDEAVKSGSNKTEAMEQTTGYKLTCKNGEKEKSKVAQCKVQDTTER